MSPEAQDFPGLVITESPESWEMPPPGRPGWAGHQVRGGPHFPGARLSPVKAASRTARSTAWGSAGEGVPAGSASVCTMARHAALPTAHWEAAPR